MHGTRNRRKYRHCKKPPNDKPPSEEEIQATRSRIFRQHIAHLMRRSGFFDELRSDAEIEPSASVSPLSIRDISNK